MSTAFAIAALLLPVVFYAWYVARDGVNVPRWDDWEIIPIASGYLHGNLTASMLWNQHNENRMLVPYLIDLAFTRFGNLNFHALMFFSIVLIVAAYAILARTFFRTGRSTIWAFVPVSYIGLSLAQHQNALWGFQIAWYLVALFLSIALSFLTTTGELPNWRLAAATIAAVIGSFCSFQGLLIWVAGLVVIVFLRMPHRVGIPWVAVGIATTAIYFIGFAFNATGGGSSSMALLRPDSFIPFFLVQFGSVTIGADPVSLWGYAWLGTLGFLLWAITVFVLVLAWRHRGDAQLALACALIVFAVLFDGFVYLGRGSGGVLSATTSRYCTYNLLLLLGDYFGLLALFRLSSHSQLGRLRLAGGVLAMILAIQLASASWFGLSAGESERVSDLQSARVTVDYLEATDGQIQTFEYPSPVGFRQVAALAQRDNLSTFASAKKCAMPQHWDFLVAPKAGHPASSPSTSSFPPPLLSTYIRSHVGATEALRELSQVYVKHPELAAGYPEWSVTFPASLLAWAGSPSGSTFGGGALAAYGSDYRAMFEVLKRTLVEGNHPADLPSVVLPAPPTLTPLLVENARAAEAWRVLSILYFERGDLVQAFPGNKPQFPANYIEWAEASARLPDADGTGSLLRAYASELQSMRSALVSPAADRNDRAVASGVLPIPRPLDRLLASDAVAYAAWMLLSSVYLSSPASPRTISPQSECFDLDLVRWALGPAGQTEPLLSAYKPQIAAMRDELML